MTANPTAPTAPMAPAAPIAPIAATQRIHTIDMLRGFALLGILLVNMELFTHSYYDYIFGMETTTQADRWARFGVQFFAEGKFYSMFSFLFGLGMAIMMLRCEARNVPFVPIYTRRLLALLGFGLIHAYLLWFGDILIFYALIGFLTLFFLRNLSPRSLVRMAVLFLLVPIVINAALYGLTAMGAAAIGEEQMQATVAEQLAYYHTRADEAAAAYSTGSYAQTVVERARTMNDVFLTLPFVIFNIWAMFALGLAAGKARLHERLGEERALLWRVLIWGGVVGILGNLIYVVASQSGNRAVMTPLSLASSTAQTIGAPALSLCYMAGLALLAQRARPPRLFGPMAAAGRMALTNYLLQTVIVTTLMYGWGFGLYGLGQAWGVALALAIWLLQLVWSPLWLRRFRFGPVEWLWRTITYARRQPMRAAPPAPAAR